MRLFFLIIILLLPFTFIAQAQEAELVSIKSVMVKQEMDWSAGNLEAFMEGYWKSDKLRFSSGGNIQRGWQGTLDRYKKRYPDKATMGTLTFSNIEISLLEPDWAVAFGHWKLTLAADTPSGLFTLTFHKFPEGWRIVHDHTSSATEK